MPSVLWVATGLNATLTGIERLVVDSVIELSERSSVCRQTVVAHRGDEWLSMLPPETEVLLTHRRKAEIARVPRTPHVASPYDFVHSYGAVPPRGALWTGYTVHDWGPFFDASMSRTARAAWMVAMSRGVARADGLHFMSRSVASEAPALVRRVVRAKQASYGLAAVGSNATRWAESDVQRDPSLVLTVGSDLPRKRFGLLAAAVETTPTLRLVCAGGGTEQRDAPPVVRGLGRVPDEELNRLYREAQVFALISEYEGFGLPALEAWEAGCQLVLSQAVAKRLPEQIAADAIVVEDDATVDAVSNALVVAAASPTAANRTYSAEGVVISGLLDRVVPATNSG